ncbi:hypothetical protein BK133_18615 [Paenibacillus sp. FSL H8-0548]|nr:hypothetical protein BK133_18615 [Paenibacillus sp. FSL H8-0548]
MFQELDGWTRRRLRMCKWRQWKLPKTKVRELISLGVPKHKAYEWGNSRKKYWRIALSPVLSRALGNQYWTANELQSLTERYTIAEYDMNRRIPNGTYGGVRGRGLVAPSY